MSSITTTSDALPQARECSHHPQVDLLQLMLMYLAEPGADCIKPPRNAANARLTNRAHEDEEKEKEEEERGTQSHAKPPASHLAGRNTALITLPQTPCFAKLLAARMSVPRSARFAGRLLPPSCYSGHVTKPAHCPAAPSTQQAAGCSQL